MTTDDDEAKREQRRRHYQAHKEEIKAYYRAYHEAHKVDPEYVERRRLSSQRSHEAHRDERLRNQRERHAQRLRDDPEYLARSKAINRRNNEKRIAKKLAPVRKAATRGCALCPETEIVCLDFHHLDPSTKSFDVSQSARQKKNEVEIQAEIRKCAVLCANCHRKLHAGAISLEGFDLAAYWANWPT